MTHFDINALYYFKYLHVSFKKELFLQEYNDDIFVQIRQKRIRGYISKFGFLKIFLIK